MKKNEDRPIKKVALHGTSLHLGEGTSSVRGLQRAA